LQLVTSFSDEGGFSETLLHRKKNKKKKTERKCQEEWSKEIIDSIPAHRRN
jgi:hypothetical protein